MYRHILIASDGSNLAGKGLDAGLALAAALQARATLVTVSDPWQDVMAADPSAMALTGELREERRRQKEAEAQAVFEDARKRAQAAGVALETVYVPERLPDEAILETADRCGADLVVMASHGHRGLRKLLLGSQTQAVVSRGHLPVLVVR
ncbi:universal stress protein [uncultured Luteimonas sp.]|uniref:universal stress protein n=1 Tax=uncultured Luteimonas sp. TaxID=453144 RepID=UPI002638E27A|nr:universal stress protein [uncultured Luteimonas sp.]